MKLTVPVFLVLLLAEAMGLGAQAPQVRPSPVPGASTGARRAAVPPLSFHLSPSLEIPVGDLALYYGIGGGGAFSVEYRLPFLPILYLKGELGYGVDPLLAGSISVPSLSAGVGLRLDITRWLALRAFGTGGFYSGFENDFTEYKGQTDGMVSGGASLSFAIAPAFALGLGASYDHRFYLYSGVRAFLVASYTIGAESKRAPRILIGDVELADVFPVFANYYDTHSLGRVSIQTDESEPLQDVKVTFFVKQYMDAPKECTAPTTLQKGAAQPVELNALFTSRVLDVTEATKAAGEITVSCRWRGEQFSQTKVVSMRFENRNAITWDDDRKAAAFVTSMDPLVLSLSKSAAGVVRERGNGETNTNLLTAMAIHEALREFGLAYVVDPKSSYAELSAQETALDYVQFPRQTLEYKAGDCDDLSVLYCALLESVGIETALLSYPGHLLMAFSLGMEPAEASRFFSRPDELFYRDGKTWLPIEITARNEHFLPAWQLGARQWAEHAAKGDLAIYPVRDSWKLFGPVGFPSSGGAVALPAVERISKAYAVELDRFAEREVGAREAEIREKLASSPNDPKLLNRLGIAYGKYGLTDRAISTFRSIIARQEYVPALVNLGTALFIQGDASGALGMYERAARREPQDAYVLLGLARAYQALRRTSESLAAYAKLKAVNPWLASQHAYLATQGGG